MDVKRRVRQVGLLMVALFLIPAFQLWNYQLRLAPWLDAHQLNPRHREEVDLRGRILDRQGEELAVTRTGVRRYPLGPAAAPLLGYWNRQRGKGGLEHALDKELVGRPKPRSLPEVRRIMEVGSRRGNDVVLTLDARLQEAAYAALNGRRGAVVVLDVPTGQILAAASYPAFDPMKLDRDWARLTKDKSAPFIERATQGLYEPGSTFKLLVLGAVLTEGLAKASETFVCQGVRLVNFFELHDAGQAHGFLTLQQALVKSCNPTFAELGLRLKLPKLRGWMERAGMLAAPAGVPIAASGRAPEGLKDEIVGAAQAAIGQASILVTPLAMATLAADLARGGEHVEPTLVKARLAGQQELPGDSPARSPLFSPEIARFITDAMGEVVQQGTGTAARISGVRVGGKTGTAENPHGEDHAWFVGFGGTYAVAVILENQGFGGVHAAPVARTVLEKALKEEK